MQPVSKLGNWKVGWRSVVLRISIIVVFFGMLFLSVILNENDSMLDISILAFLFIPIVLFLVSQLFLKNIFFSINILILGIFFWFVFSLVTFDGFFFPNQAIGLINLEKYYKNNIEIPLVRYGQEYKIKGVSIDDENTYRNNQRNFEFKYPKEMTYEISNQRRDGYDINFSNNLKNDKCKVSLKFSGRGIGKKWLPRIARGINYSIDNKKAEELWYIYKNNDAFNIKSTRLFYDDIQEVQFTDILLVDKKSGKFMKLSFGNNCSEEMIKGVLKTFQFK